MSDFYYWNGSDYMVFWRDRFGETVDVFKWNGCSYCDWQGDFRSDDAAREWIAHQEEQEDGTELAEAAE